MKAYWCVNAIAALPRGLHKYLYRRWPIPIQQRMPGSARRMPRPVAAGIEWADVLYCIIFAGNGVGSLSTPGAGTSA